MSKGKKSQTDLKVQAERMDYAINKLIEHNIEFTALDAATIEIDNPNGFKIHFFPYTGWHTGKGIKDGRGLQNLLKQLK